MQYMQIVFLFSYLALVSQSLVQLQVVTNLHVTVNHKALQYLSIMTSLGNCDIKLSINNNYFILNVTELKTH
jgi:hypothetical protein